MKDTIFFCGSSSHLYTTSGRRLPLLSSGGRSSSSPSHLSDSSLCKSFAVNLTSPLKSCVVVVRRHKSLCKFRRCCCLLRPTKWSLPFRDRRSIHRHRPFCCCLWSILLSLSLLILVSIYSLYLVIDFSFFSFH
jgi:hypothetical protein